MTQIARYRIAPFAYCYVTNLRQDALGNLKAFVHAIGLDPTMLLYLNGTQNRVGEPNENYAGELLELFTIGQLNSEGQANYTQFDIQSARRYLVSFDAGRLASGRYAYQLQTESGIETRHMTLIR